MLEERRLFFCPFSKADNSFSNKNSAKSHRRGGRASSKQGKLAKLLLNKYAESIGKQLAT
jgi:hypothetical protein